MRIRAKFENPSSAEGIVEYANERIFATFSAQSNFNKGKIPDTSINLDWNMHRRQLPSKYSVARRDLACYFFHRGETSLAASSTLLRSWGCDTPFCLSEDMWNEIRTAFRAHLYVYRLYVSRNATNMGVGCVVVVGEVSRPKISLFITRFFTIGKLRPSFRCGSVLFSRLCFLFVYSRYYFGGLSHSSELCLYELWMSIQNVGNLYCRVYNVMFCYSSHKVCFNG